MDNMKEKIVKEIIEHLYKNVSKDNQKKFDEMEIAKRFEEYINNQTKDLSEEESLHLLDKLKLSIEQADLGYKFEDITYEDMDRLSNVNNYIIKMEDTKDLYSLEELLGKCSLKQLNLYHTFYSYMFNIYKVEKIHNKEELISTLKKDILFSFKSYIEQIKKKEIEFFKNVLKSNGIIDNVDEDFIQTGFFIPFQLKKAKIRYVMAKELLDIIEKCDFSVTSEKTKSSVSKLLEYFVASKGIVSQYEVEKFVIGVANLNIKKEELFEIMDNKFSKKDDYYYVEKIINTNLFNKLVQIKKENPHIPEYEEIVEFQSMVEELYSLLIKIANEEVKMGRIMKDMFYQPSEVPTLVNKLSKKLKINKKNRNRLEEFIYENYFYFRYWVYNGECGDFDDLDDSFFDFEGFEGLESDDDLEITETDLPF